MLRPDQSAGGSFQTCLGEGRYHIKLPPGTREMSPVVKGVGMVLRGYIGYVVEGAGRYINQS